MGGKVSKKSKLPVQQLIILAICRVADPIVLTSVFPYLPEMMTFLGVETTQIAFYAGLTSATFSFCQALTGVAWGYASDRYGRKPVILLGMSCTMITSILFGFSRSVTWAMVTRGLGGLGAGNVGTLRTTVAEMVPQRDLQPRAFSIMPLVWNVGSIFGPILGGFLANPARTYPQLFGTSRFFKTFPYALPNLVASSLFLFGFAAGILFLHETLETHKDRRDYGLVLGGKLKNLVKRQPARSVDLDPSEEGTSPLLSHHYTGPSTVPSDRIANPQSGAERGVDESLDDTARILPPTYRNILVPQSIINLFAYTLLCLHSTAFDSVLPVFLHHPRQHHRSYSEPHLPLKFAGGFGIKTQEIGFLFMLYGICGMLTQFFVFPMVARRFGILRCLKVCSVLFPVVYLLTPFTVLVKGTKTQERVIFGLMLIKCLAAIFAFPCTVILLTNSAASLRILGTLNGIATSTSALGKAAGPAISGWTFSAGIAAGYVIIPWWTIAGLALLGTIPVWLLVEKDGFDIKPLSDAIDQEESVSANEDGSGKLIRPVRADSTTTRR